MADMKHAFHLSGIPLLLVAAFGPGDGFGVTASQTEQQAGQCYGLAMVGMDSVINSRLGIYPDRVLHLAVTDPHSEIASRDEIAAAAPYSTRLLKIIFDAYLWQGEPNEYASRVLDNCPA
jgi:hypothetical protein